MRPARTQRLKTRTWTEVHAVESMVQHHARVYTRAWQSMLDLGADAPLHDRYRVLEREDLKINTTVIAPNVRGQRNKSLPWFWSIDVRRDADVGEWMNDCRCFSLCTLVDAQQTNKFKCSLSSALAEGKGSKSAVDRRASGSPSRDGVCHQIFSTSRAILEKETGAC